MFRLFAKNKKVKAQREVESKRPTRYVGDGNGLYLEGIQWPPVIRDDSHYDRTDLFKAIADGLNNGGRYKFMLDKLESAVDGYNNGSKSAGDVKDDVLKIVQVLRQNP